MIATTLPRPGAQLARLRVVTLRAVANALLDARRKARACELIGRYFPAELAGVGLFDHWTTTFREFLGLVDEAGWLPVDWGLLNDLWQKAYSEGYDEEDTEPDSFALSAEYLWSIPCATWGMLDKEFDDEIYHTPPAALLAVYGGALVWHETLDDYFDAPPDIDDWRPIYERLRTHDFGQYEEPLCWLPDLVDFACDRTGNVILDTSLDMMDIYDWVGMWRWDDRSDLAVLRKDWTAGKPLVEKWQRFLEWCEGQEEMEQIAAILTGGQTNEPT